MRAPLLALAALAASGCSLIYQPEEADRPSTAAEVDAHFAAYYDEVLDARGICSGTSPDHARTLWLGPKTAYLDRQQAVFAGGRVRLDRALAGDCLAEIAASVPRCTLLDAVLDDPARACRRAFAGVVPEGADCASDTECSTGARCVSGMASCPGHCTRLRALGEVCDDSLPCGFDMRCGWAIGAPPVGDMHCFPLALGEGADCSGTGIPPCGVGLTCQGDGMVMTCVPLLGPDATCTSSGECRPELFCDAGACRTRIPPAWSCTPSASGQCERDAWCDEATGRCVAFATSGSCGTQATGEVKGCIDGSCVSGSCTPFAAYGAACSAGQDCAPLDDSVACDAASGACGERCL